jgi:hypothetical protein
MSAKMPSKAMEITEPVCRVSGSTVADFTETLLAQVYASLWVEHSDAKTRGSQIRAALTVMGSIEPRDELEGMLSAQLIAIHNAAMECYRRAMIGDQTFEGRRENLNQANKLSRNYVAMMDALDRHRGKGHQRITVEHVTVHAGGQAIVGNVTPSDESSRRSEEQTSATRRITNEPGIPMRSPDPQWETMPIAAGARKRPV